MKKMIKFQEELDDTITVVGKLNFKRDPTPSLYLYNIMNKIKNNESVKIKVLPGCEHYITEVINLLCWENKRFMIFEELGFQIEKKLKKIHLGEDGKKYVMIRKGDSTFAKKEIRNQRFIKRGKDLFIQTKEDVKYKVYLLKKPGHLMG